MKKRNQIVLFCLLMVAVTAFGCGKHIKNKETVASNKQHSKDLRKEEKRQEAIFTMKEIVPGDEIYQRIYGHSYPKDASIPLAELRYLTMFYYGFDGKTHEGEMIVHRDVAQEVLAIFEQLYAVRYPIERMQLVDDFDADDTKSMQANNTSAFNYRKIANSNQLSNHSYGMAIDINPLYNPYVYEYNGQLHVEPEEGRKYADRTKEFPYMIKKDDVCYRAFAEHGFSWGGDFSTRKDYQHFEKKRKP